MERPLGSKYVLETALGRGATGEVWKGRTVADGTELAFKVLHDALARDPETVRRFLQESTILVQLQHPNLVRVHDLVAEGETLAIVMDLVGGRDLRGMLHQFRTLPPAEACRIAADTAAALAAVHDMHVVHRDIKPENVLLDQRQDPPAVRVTDFGIARIAEQSGSGRSTMLVGTPQYIAPEVFDGKAPTSASDLYALGIMLYEICCGVTPFAGGSTLQILRRHVENAPGRPEGMPDPLWDLICALLAKNPADRPGPANAVANQLVALAHDLAGLAALPALTEPPVSIPLVHDQLTDKVELPRQQSASPIAPLPAEPPAPQGSGARPRRRGRKALLAFAVVLVLAAGGAGAWAVLGQTSGNSPLKLGASQPPTGPVAASSQPDSPSPAATTVTATPSGSGNGTGGADASPQPSVPAPSGTTYLAELQPVHTSRVGSITTGAEQFGTTTYQNSVRFLCNGSGDVTYNVAGAKFLATTLGVPNNATNAVGNTMAITFVKDGTTPLRSPVNVVVGKPQTVHLDLQGASQLEIQCAATDTNHYAVQMDIALGQATIGAS